MESTTKQVRVVMPLLKARIIDRGPDHFTISFGHEYGSPTSIRISTKTDMLDLRDGDLLTLYTEVMLKNAEANN